VQQRLLAAAAAAAAAAADADTAANVCDAPTRLPPYYIFVFTFLPSHAADHIFGAINLD